MLRWFTSALVIGLCGLAVVQTARALPAILADPAASMDVRGGCETGTQAMRKALTSKPLSSEVWLSVAACQLDRGAGETRITQALRLSRITSAHQHYEMFRRALFALSHWTALPAEWKDSTGADLIGETFDQRETAELGTALSRQPENVRKNILMTLQSQGVAASTLVAIGF